MSSGEPGADSAPVMGETALVVGPPVLVPLPAALSARIVAAGIGARQTWPPPEDSEPDHG